jgi:hypothetical protein
LHTITVGHATELYNRWEYSAGGWTRTGGVTDEDIGIDLSGTNYHGTLVVDSNSVVWVLYWDTTNRVLKTRYRSGGSWAAGPDIADSDLAMANSRVAVSAWTDDDGDPGIICAYGYQTGGVNSWQCAYRKDSASLAASWTLEDIEDPVAAGTPDNHVSIQTCVFSGDTESTVIVAVKNSLNEIWVFRRPPGGGTWGTDSAFGDGVGSPDYTRPRVTIDATNKEVYVSATVVTSPVRLEYAKSIANGTLAFGSIVTAIEDDGAGTFDTNHVAPQSPVTSSTGLLYAADRTGGVVWWNILTIAGASGGGKPWNYYAQAS